MLVILVGMAFAITGCGSAGNTFEDSASDVTAEGYQEPLDMSGEELMDLVKQARDNQTANMNKGLIEDLTGFHIPYDLDTIIDLADDILKRSKYALRFEKIMYNSRDAHGNKVQLSALLIVPWKLFKKPSLPILGYNHGTELYRGNAPSTFKDNPLDVINVPEVIIASAMASSGYIVVMPDYQGMGESNDIQPYVHKIQGRQSADAIKAAKQYTKKPWKFGRLFSPVSWNKKLYLIGYSQGGYVTMQTAKFLQKRRSRNFPVTAVAALAGPHSISDVMIGPMTSDNEYKQPFFLPMVVSAYESIYGSPFTPDEVYVEPFNETLVPLMDGNTKSGTVNAAMGMTTDPLSFIVPSTVLQAELIDELLDSSSEVRKILRKNDSHRGWVPQMPVRMFHHVNDELVMHENSVVALEKFEAKGAPNVSLESVTDEIDVREDSTDTYHAYAAPLIIFKAWEWLLSQ